MNGGARGVDIRVLGPMEVGAADQVIDVGGPKVRAVLALLAANAGRAVSVAALVDALWGDHAPPDAERTVRTYVSRLRRALTSVLGPDEAAGLIATRPPGYLLPDPTTVDAVRFERLAAAGRRALAAGEPAAGKDRLVAALRLWRGPAYGEFGDITALSSEGTRLALAHGQVVEDRVAADLAAGLGSELVAELEGLTATYPGNERLWGQLMTALYRAGRQADALAVFGRARRVLVEGFGVEPSPVLAGTYQRVLAREPGLLAAGAPEQVDGQRQPPGTEPAQLPPAVPAFIGRQAELAALDASLPLPGNGSTIAVSVLCGKAGVGKTALAVHWAHRVASRFPDGQLYVDLRGFDPNGSTLDPADALYGFLTVLAVPPQSIPATLDGRSAQYRSLTSGKRVLVLLDNARDAGQVRPLLPASPGSMVVVTSRDNLAGLIARDGACRVPLGVADTVGPLAALSGERAGHPTVGTLAQ